MKPERLKPLLDEFVEARPWAERVAADPVEFPHRFKDPRDIAKLTATQDRLLDSAVELLRDGGTLVYCTCSLQPEEGRARIDALLARHPQMRRAPIGAFEVGGLEELLTTEGDLRSFPYQLAQYGGIDGFYAARMVKG